MKINRLLIISFVLIFLLVPQLSIDFSSASVNSTQDTPAIQTIAVGSTTTVTLNILNNNGLGFYYLNIPSTGSYELSLTVVSNSITSINAQIIGLVNVSSTILGSYQIPYTVMSVYGSSSTNTPLKNDFTLPAVFSPTQLGLTLQVNSQASSVAVKVTITNLSTTKGVSATVNVPDSSTHLKTFVLDSASLGISTAGFYNVTTKWDLQTVLSSTYNIAIAGNLQISQNAVSSNELSSTLLNSNYQSHVTTTNYNIVYLNPSNSILVTLNGYSSYCSTSCSSFNANLTATLTSAQKITPATLNSGQSLNITQEKIIQLNVNLNNFYALNSVRSNGKSNAVYGTPSFTSSIQMTGNSFANGNYYLNSFNSFQFYYANTSVPYLDIQYSPTINGLSTPQGGIATIQGFTTFNTSTFYTSSVSFDVGSGQVSFSSLSSQNNGVYIIVYPNENITLSLAQITPTTLPLNTTVNLDPTNPDTSAKIYQINTTQNDIVEYSSNLQLTENSNIYNYYSSLDSNIMGSGTGLINSNYLYANTSIPYQPFLFTTSSGTSYIFLTSEFYGNLGMKSPFSSTNATLQSVFSLIPSKSVSYEFIKTKVAQFPNDYTNIYYSPSESIFTLPVSSGQVYTFTLGGAPFAGSAGYFILLDQNGNLMVPDGTQGAAGYISSFGYSFNYRPTKSQTVYLVVFGSGYITMHVHQSNNVSQSSPGFDLFITFFGLLAIVPLYLYKKKKLR